MSVATDITLTAEWIDYYQVAFNANGGYFDGGDEVLYQYFAPGNVIIEDVIPQREGYDFDGWSLDGSRINTLRLRGNVELVALWEPVIEITYDANGGYWQFGEEESFTTVTTIEMPGLYYIGWHEPVREGYVFAGWTVNGASVEFVELSGPITVVAQWAVEVEVTYDANGGSWDGNDLIRTENAWTGDYSVDYDWPWREGCEFIGWSTDPDATAASTRFTYELEEATTFYAIWEHRSDVEICYDANGGSWENGNTAEYHYLGAGEYYYVGMYEPSREGYEFVGWADTNGNIVDGDEYILRADETYIFFAQWVEVHTIVYDANGGQFDNYDEWNYETSTMHIRTARVDEEYYLDGAEPFKDRCQFIGWSLDGVNPVANPMTVESDIRLYALWRESCDVTYVTSIGCWADWWDEHGYPQNPKSTIFDSGIDGEYFINGWWPEAGEAYRFVGYATYPNATEAEYTPGQYVGLLDGDMTLYAVWQKRPKITYNANGGQWGEGETARVEYQEVGRRYYVRYEQPWQDGYEFVGWEDENGNLVDNDMLTLAEGDEYVFFARWVKQIVITYYANGGSWDDNRTFEYHYNREGEYYYVGTGSPWREGYDFDCWVDSEGDPVDGCELILQDGVDYTFFARWIQRVTVTYDANGGAWDDYCIEDGETSSIHYRNERVGEYYTDGYEPEREGYWFVGWSLDGMTPIENPITLESDITLVALWKKQITITYTTSIGGWREWDENGQEVLLTSIVRDNGGDEIRVDGWRPETNDPYRFLGYAIDDVSNGVAYYPDDILEIGEKDITLCAVWEHIPTITYHAEGGAWGEGEGRETIRVEWQEIGRKYYVRNEWPQLDGYEFAGWVDEDGNPADNRMLTMAEGDEYHFYATWKQRLTVTYDANGGHWGIDPFYHDTEQFDAVEGDYRVGNWYPDREGYFCRGWSTDPNATSGQPEFNIALTENTTIYAVWEKNAKLTLDAGEGAYFSELEGAIHTEYYRIGFVIGTTTGELPRPYREGYSFVGWTINGESVSRRYRMVSDATFTAEWVKNAQIGLDAEGGVFPNGSSYCNVFFEDGDFLILQNSLPEPTKAGYNFDGWYLDEECTESVTYWSCEAEEIVTFYAAWVEGDPVTVTWDANGGYIWGDSDYPTYSETFPVNSFINMEYRPSREGYLFAGWYLDEDFNESVDTWDYLASKDVTFYARWSEGVTITWDGNGGTIWPEGGSNAPTYTKKVLEGSTVGGCTTPDREGYVFMGWCFDLDCEVPVYDIWSYVVNEDVTFYAKWAKAVQITWNGNGGFIWADTDYPTYTATYAKDQRISYGYSVYRDDYAFEGWYLDKDCTISVDFDNYVATENVSFYAKWSQAVYVTWDCNGGCIDGDEGYTSVTEIITSNTGLYGPANITRNGYVFIGWYVDSDCEVPLTKDYALSKDVTFYAGWAEAATITWDGNGGEFPQFSSPIYSEMVTLGYRTGCPTPEREGYMLNGWYLDADCTEPLDYDCYYISSDITFYAGWIEATKVTWDGNGGFRWGNTEYPAFSETYRKNQTITNYYGDFNTFLRSGYVFDGWYFDAECNNVVDFETYILTNDVTFYAKWAEPVYVTWDANGGYLWGEPDDTILIFPRAKGSVLQDSISAERDGFYFDGWYLDEDCTISVNPWQYVITEDVTFYAGWVEEGTNTTRKVSSITTREPLQLIENVDGFVGADDSFFYTYMHSESYGDVLNNYGFELIINYTDGSCFVGTCDEINALGYGGVYFSDDQLTSRWYVGGDNYIYVSYQGTVSSIPVTIVQNTVIGISCSDTVQIVAGTDGYEDYYNGSFFHHYYSAQPVWVDYENGKHYDDFYNHDLIYTVTFTDREPLVGNAQTLYEQTGLCLTISDDEQWTPHWVLGGTYFITANFAGCSTRIPVTIVEREITSITCNGALNLVYDVDGFYTSDECGEFFCYDYKEFYAYGDVLNDWNFELTIHYADGSSFTGNCDQINSLDEGGLWFTDTQYDEHWLVGGKHYITVHYRDGVSTIPVTISPVVTSITCSEPLRLIENVDGCTMTSTWGEEYFCYNYKHRESYGDVLNENGFELTIQFADGSFFTGTCDEINALGYGGVYFSDSQDEVHWIANNTSYVNVSYRGTECSIPVTIVRNTVLGISCSNSIQIIENSKGSEEWYNGNSFYKYYASEPTWVDYENGKYYDNFYNQDLIYTVTFTDRDPIVGDAKTLYEETGFCLTISGDEQWTRHWIVGGTYFVTASFAGCNTRIPVSIVSKDVSSITFDRPICLTEEGNGYLSMKDEDEFFFYEYKYYYASGDEVLHDSDFVLTIHYSDGTTFTGNSDAIVSLDEGRLSFSDNQYDAPWTAAGENYVTVSYRGYEGTIPVVIVPQGSVCVTWNANGGTFGPTSSFSEIVAKNAWIYRDTHIVNREGYAFDGWYLDADCTTEMPYGYKGEGNVVFYAKWAEAVYITYDANGGCFRGDPTLQSWTGSVRKNDELMQDMWYSYYGEPTRDGYVFAFWYFNPECTGDYVRGDEIITEDVTIYAKWLEAVNVTFVGNGGTFYVFNGKGEHVSGETETVAWTKEASPMRQLEMKYRSGYTFDGWYSDEECTQSVDIYNDTFTKDITLYAKWVEN